MRVEGNQPQVPGPEQSGGSPLTKALGQFVFQQLDADGKGGISKEEAAKIPALAQMFDQVNTNGDAELDAEEFAAAMGGGKAGGPGGCGPDESEEAPGEGKGKGKGRGQGQGQAPGATERSPLNQAIAEFVFNLLNKDGNTELSPEELAAMPEFGEAFDDLDADESGGLSAEEFAAATGKPQKPAAT